jgi:hypothetical protein
MPGGGWAVASLPAERLAFLLKKNDNSSHFVEGFG